MPFASTVPENIITKKFEIKIEQMKRHTNVMVKCIWYNYIPVHLGGKFKTEKFLCVHNFIAIL